MKPITITELKRISNPKGDIYHALKCSEEQFSVFGEAYFTTINQDDIKGWKKHLKMEMNLIVPVGDVTFYIYDEKANIHDCYRINASNYCRLTVPAGYWMAFKGHDPQLNLVLNIASLEHEPSEAVNTDISTFKLES